MKLIMVACLAVCGEAQLPDVHDIMLRVAFNQAKSQDARRQFVFREKQTVRLRRANGNLAHEEYREYQIAPTERGIHRELLTLHGCYEEKGDYVLYDRPQHEVEGPEPAAGALQRDPMLGEVLRRLIAALPEAARMVMVLRYQEDLEPAEIAELIEMPLATVKSHLHRSLAMLRQKLARRGVGEP